MSHAQIRISLGYPQMAIGSPPTCYSPLFVARIQTYYQLSDLWWSIAFTHFTSDFNFLLLDGRPTGVSAGREQVCVPTSARMTSPGNFWSQSGKTKKVPRNLVDGIWSLSPCLLLINVRIVTSHTDVHFVLWVACSMWEILVCIYYARFGFEDLSLSPILEHYPISHFILFLIYFSKN